MNDYKISIIIPTFNREEYLSQAIESAMAQDYPNIEIIIMDNASTDNTQYIVKSYMQDIRIKYVVNTQNIGMVNNWKKALYEYVTGDWFVILSDDDYFVDSSYLSSAIKLIQEDKKILLVYASGFLLDTSSNKTIKLNIPFKKINCGKKVFLSRNNVKPIDFILCNVLFNTKASIRLDCFNSPYNICCDSQLFLQLCLRGEVGYIEKEVAIYRLHTFNLTNKIFTDYKLFLASWEYLSIPFSDAKANKLLDVLELNLFEQKQIYQEIYKVLLNSAIFFPEKFLEIRQKLNQDFSPHIVNLVTKNKFLRIKIFVAISFPKIYTLLQKIKNKRLESQ